MRPPYRSREAIRLASDRAAKARLIAAAAPLRDSASQKLTEAASGNAQFQAELARHCDGSGNAPSGECGPNQRPSHWSKRKLAKEPENSALAVRACGTAARRARERELRLPGRC